ncbi:MAG: signal peptidase II [Candidatus Margulisiibacteriota bacterium]|nr:signal peptidase II [Candidatus Margulisiibacteriota bacterium]
MSFYLLAILITVIDQSIKQIIHLTMPLGKSIPLFWILKLTYVGNTGAAFSLFSGFSNYLIIISVVVVAAVIYFHYRVPITDRLAQTGLAFILGGSIGNLVDRVFRSYVIDYIDITVWPVFNFADIMINLGVFLIIIRMFKHETNSV